MASETFGRMLLEMLSKHVDVKLVILFGSYAENSQSVQSDIDIAFLSESVISNLQRWHISQEIASELSRDVDLVDLAQANDVLRYQIVTTGEILYNDGKDLFLDQVFSNYLQLNDDRQEILKHYAR